MGGGGRPLSAVLSLAAWHVDNLGGSVSCASLGNRKRCRNEWLSKCRRRPASHCTVLPPGEFNGMIPDSQYS